MKSFMGCVATAKLYERLQRRFYVFDVRIRRWCKYMTEVKESLFLVFTVGERRFALSAKAVERVVAAVEVTIMPDAPTFFRGVINYGGALVPVIDLRVRFGLPVRRIWPSDRLLFVSHAAAGLHEKKTLFALLVEGVEGVSPIATEKISLPDGLDEKFDGLCAGLESGDDRVVSIQTMDTLFSMTDTEIQEFQNLYSVMEDAAL